MHLVHTPRILELHTTRVPTVNGKVTELKFPYCTNDAILVHRLAPDTIESAHASFRKCGSPCPEHCAGTGRKEETKNAS